MGEMLTVDPKLYKDILYDLFCCFRGFTDLKNKGGKMAEIRVIYSSESLFIAL